MLRSAAVVERILLRGQNVDVGQAIQTGQLRQQAGLELSEHAGCLHHMPVLGTSRSQCDWPGP